MKNIIARAVLAGLLATAGPYAAADTFNLNTISPPASSTYGNTFATQAGNFVDDFVFTISPGGTFNTIAATLDLGSLFQIQDLQARLYQGIGPFVSGTTTLEEAWGTMFSAGGGSGTVTVLNQIALPANTYTLEIRGDVTGSNGGSYSGALNLATLPVPEPETYALMLAGLGMLGWIGTRRRRTV